VEEKRKNKRLRCLLGAKIVFNNQTATMSCLVKNISDTGASLEFGAVPLMPQDFELLLDSEAGYSKATVVWQDLNKIGVAFPHSQIGNGKKGLAIGLLMQAMPIQSQRLH
jgi:hypothetical protein